MSSLRHRREETQSNLDTLSFLTESTKPEDNLAPQLNLADELGDNFEIYNSQCNCRLLDYIVSDVIS